MMAIEVRVPRADQLPRSCRRADGNAKVLYPTRDAARAVVRRYRAGVKGLHAYFCERCQGYHVGRPMAVRHG